MDQYFCLQSKTTATTATKVSSTTYQCPQRYTKDPYELVANSTYTAETAVV